MEVEFLGIKKVVQPICKCEQDRKRKFERQRENHIKQLEIKKLFSISSLGKRFEQATLDTFIQREGAENAFNATKDYIAHYPSREEESLLIWGEPGNGKTLLAASVANAISKKGYVVVFQSVPELLRRIKSTFDQGNKETENLIIRALLECDLLILDDIGSERLTDWSEEKIYDIIDGRYRAKKPIFYTSNLIPKELAGQVDKRCYDRMLETSIMIENKATSYRREIAKQRVAQYHLGRKP